MRFQISQRADHIVNDIYQWVQFNRAIINARDEPLADYRKFRRLHLLIGDSNMSPFATALKVGTTACILTLLEEGKFPRGLILQDAVVATREVSHQPDGPWPVELENGETAGALEIQWRFLEAAGKYLQGRDAEIDWLLESWSFVLDSLQPTQTRLSAVSIGLQSDGCWRSSRKRSPFLGMIRGYSVSIWNIITSIHRVAFSFR